jgi:hypothetical protein
MLSLLAVDAYQDSYRLGIGMRVSSAFFFAAPHQISLTARTTAVTLSSNGR